MFKKIKGKVVCSLLVGVLFCSSMVSAANINYGGSYNNYKQTGNYGYGHHLYNGYNYNYNSNNNYNNYKNNTSQKPENSVTNNYPNFIWNVVTPQADINNGNSVVVPRPEPVNPNVPSIGDRPVEESKPVVPAEPSAPVVSGLSQIEAEVLRLVNIERQKGGLAPLIADGLLTSVAQKKSEDMARNNYFSHTSPTYGSPFAMMKTFGVKYSTAAENIARGQLTAQSVMNGWMNSSGHKANIMNPSFKKIGIGMVESNDGRKCWTQMFTN